MRRERSFTSGALTWWPTRAPTSTAHSIVLPRARTWLIFRWIPWPGWTASWHAYQEAVQPGQGIQRKISQVLARGKTMEWAVEVGARVGHHVNAPDVKLRSLRINGPRGFAAEEVTDQRSWQTFVSNHAVFDRMAEVDEHGGKCLTNRCVVRALLAPRCTNSRIRLGCRCLAHSKNLSFTIFPN